MKKKIITQIPNNWRKGQFLFNFLEWLEVKGVDTNQNHRLADSFYLSDEDFDNYLEEYIKELGLEKDG